jgi:hypothetical protein
MVKGGVMKKSLTLILVLLGLSAFAAIPTTPGWHQIPNTQLGDVCACTKGGFSSICGANGYYDCWGIFAWSGGVMDTKRNRLIVFGGGHNDYYGNEIYALDLDNEIMERINDPGLPPASGCVEAIAGGTQPNSRHTYDGIEYMENLDKMFVCGGSLACGDGNFGRWTWTYDFETMKWEKRNPSGPIPRDQPGLLTAYDPNTGLIFLHDRKQLYSYDYATDTYTARGPQMGGDLGYHMCATIDTKRKLFVIAGYDGSAGGGRVYTIDIGPGSNYQLQQVNTSGGGGIIGKINIGVEYDPVGDQVMAWHGGDAYGLNLGTRQWARYSYSGAPSSPSYPSNWNSTFGRFRYSPKLDAFVLVNEYNQDAYVFRLPGRTAVTVKGQRRYTRALNVFPNPVTDKIGIRLNIDKDHFSHLALYDIRGRLVENLSGTLNHKSGNMITINALNIPNGIYLLRGHTSDMEFSKPVFINR